MKPLHVLRSTCRLVLTTAPSIIVVSLPLVISASRPVLLTENTDDPEPMRKLARLDTLLSMKMVLSAPSARLPEFAPFGGKFPAPRWKEGNATGFLSTSLGHLDPRSPEVLLKEVPPRLLYRPEETVTVDRGAVAAGLNYVILRPEAIASELLEVVHARIRKDAQIIGYLENASLLLYVEVGRIGALVQNNDIAFFHPMHPAYKVSLDTGVQPLLARARASDPDLKLEIYAVPGRDLAELRRGLTRVPGVREIMDYPADGSVFLVRAGGRDEGDQAGQELVRLEHDLCRAVAPAMAHVLAFQAFGRLPRTGWNRRHGHVPRSSRPLPGDSAWSLSTATGLMRRT